MGIPCTRCVSHTTYLAHKNIEGETGGRSRLQNNIKRDVKKSEWKERGHEDEKSQTRPTTKSSGC